ncbi:putative quinol monooxygenase [Carnimonas bestiolae]|uniref:putative quinol monooxygenase n=1 Tax=Carnimonas bestiolae TaxID=3402172 RepID=UPI003EDC85C9
MSITLIATVEAQQAYADEVLSALKAVIAPSHQDEGCEHYQLNRDPESATTFYMIEQWASPEALDAHSSTAHFKALVSALEGKAELSIKQLEVVS